MSAEEVLTEVKTRLEPLIAPIDGGVGVDVSYDEAFEALKNEVDKLTALAGGKVDWRQISSGAAEILSEKSKDYRVALYYAAAVANTDGIRGLLDGLVLQKELIAAFWEPMYPGLRRPKARGNLVSWYADIACAALTGFQPTTKDADVAKALDATCVLVDGELRDKLGDNYPGMMNLRNLCRGILASVPQEAPPPPAAPPPGSPPSTSQPQSQQQQQAAPAASFDSGGGMPSASIGNAEQAMTVVNQCALLLSRAGDALRVADAGNPLAYRYGRIGFWLEVQQSPPADGGATLVPPPPDGLKAQLEGMMAAENYLAVIQTADEICSTYILWLDPHRFIANAMDRLGANFINAKKAVIREVQSFLARAPQLPNLSFSDGTPFADGQTKMWLEAEVPTGSAKGGGGGGGGGAASVLDGPIAEARGLAASGKLSEAVELVAQAATTAPSGADRFRGRLAVAQLCLQAGQFAVARAQLEGLVGLVEAHRLAEWEPALCADLYASLYAAHRGLNRGDEVLPEARARENAAFERLCQFDAGAALKLSSENPS